VTRAGRSGGRSQTGSGAEKKDTTIWRERGKRVFLFRSLNAILTVIIMARTRRAKLAKADDAEKPKAKDAKGGKKKAVEKKASSSSGEVPKDTKYKLAKVVIQHCTS